MPNSESQPIYNEHYRTRGEKLVARFAGGHVRQYDSYDPRIVMDIIKDGRKAGKLVADDYPLFETGHATQLDRVDLIRGHHRAKLIFQIGNTDLDAKGFARHQVWSPDGLVGYAYGQNLDFYLASLIYNDPKLKTEAQKGGGGFDEAVQEYLAKELGMPGLFNR
jgi:hypothetical protein